MHPCAAVVPAQLSGATWRQGVKVRRPSTLGSRPIALSRKNASTADTAAPIKEIKTYVAFRFYGLQPVHF